MVAAIMTSGQCGCTKPGLVSASLPQYPELRRTSDLREDSWGHSSQRGTKVRLTYCTVPGLLPFTAPAVVGLGQLRRFGDRHRESAATAPVCPRVASRAGPRWLDLSPNRPGLEAAALVGRCVSDRQGERSEAGRPPVGAGRMQGRPRRRQAMSRIGHGEARPRAPVTPQRGVPRRNRWRQAEGERATGMSRFAS
jgi:hypothetical protein